MTHGEGAGVGADECRNSPFSAITICEDSLGSVSGGTGATLSMSSNVPGIKIRF